jgi:hypothetical protein
MEMDEETRAQREAEIQNFVAFKNRMFDGMRAAYKSGYAAGYEAGRAPKPKE